MHGAVDVDVDVDVEVTGDYVEVVDELICRLPACLHHTWLYHTCQHRSHQRDQHATYLHLCVHVYVYVNVFQPIPLVQTPPLGTYYPFLPYIYYP
jgi:hypothetical protein